MGKRPSCVAPSPSRFSARMLSRPSAARRTSWASAIRASRGRPGARLTAIGRERLTLISAVRFLSVTRRRDMLVQAPPPAYNSRCGIIQGPQMSNVRRILIIDDDDELRESLSEQLTLHEEFEAALAATASEGLKQARNCHVDLVLLDVGLPDLDGREACKLLRRGGFKGPIVMLTAQVSDADTILGLESGANDYVTKPFKLGVLLARIRAQLRQHEQSEDAVFTIGPYTFKPASKLLLDGAGGKIRLTEKETSILKYLYRAGERVVTREVLLHEVWGYNAGVTTHTLETHIYRLRQKIEKDPSQAELLITETGGYKLVP